MKQLALIENETEEKPFINPTPFNTAPELTKADYINIQKILDGEHCYDRRSDKSLERLCMYGAIIYEGHADLPGEEIGYKYNDVWLSEDAIEQIEGEL